MKEAAYPDLENASVFLSGGATGIGSVLVERFARQGARVAFVDVAASEGDALRRRLADEGHDVAFHRCDLTDLEAYRSAIESAAANQGPVTVLINNAADDVRHPLEDLTPDRFDELVAVNLKHQLFAAQSVAPMMIERGSGSIVNIGSFGWMIATGGYPVYAACKAAVHGMTRGLARDLGPHRIRVNTLVPGWVMTEKQKRLWVDDEARELIARSQCLPDPLLPDHIASMALFLASDAAAMCTAQNFIVDGGWA